MKSYRLIGAVILIVTAAAVSSGCSNHSNSSPTVTTTGAQVASRPSTGQENAMPSEPPSVMKAHYQINALPPNVQALAAGALHARQAQNP